MDGEWQWTDSLCHILTQHPSFKQNMPWDEFMQRSSTQPNPSILKIINVIVSPSDMSHLDDLLKLNGISSKHLPHVLRLLPTSSHPQAPHDTQISPQVLEDLKNLISKAFPPECRKEHALLIMTCIQLTNDPTWLHLMQDVKDTCLFPVQKLAQHPDFII